MAKRQIDLPQPSAEIIPFIPRESLCGCGCGWIVTAEREWLQCNNGVFYFEDDCVVAHMAEESNGKVLWLGHELSVHEFVYAVMEAKSNYELLKEVVSYG